MNESPYAVFNEKVCTVCQRKALHQGLNSDTNGFIFILLMYWLSHAHCLTHTNTRGLYHTRILRRILTHTPQLSEYTISTLRDYKSDWFPSRLQVQKSSKQSHLFPFVTICTE